MNRNHCTCILYVYMYVVCMLFSSQNPGISQEDLQQRVQLYLQYQMSQQHRAMMLQQQVCNCLILIGSHNLILIGSHNLILIGSHNLILIGFNGLF